MTDTPSGDEPASKGTVNEFHYFREQVYTCTGEDQIPNIYDQWAEKYDEHCSSVGYVGPANLASVASDIISEKSARILDAASGTGMVGEELKKLGFSCIDALDPSQGSLDQSKTLDAYTNYICDTLDEHRTQIQDDCYDAVVMCGAFGIPFHVTASCFPELIRITKPGGYIMFTMSTKILEEWQDRVTAAIDSFIQQGIWELKEMRWILYHVHDTISEKAKVTILRVKER
ncbi:methyltransferase-like protein 27 [Asterias amurensis]|uniref:methyltransferase-like protein 27 n=1 Tax=Asterias amurensis TaxID=7602 RepID=UPI003AB59EB6